MFDSAFDSMHTGACSRLHARGKCTQAMGSENGSPRRFLEVHRDFGNVCASLEGWASILGNLEIRSKPYCLNLSSVRGTGASDLRGKGIGKGIRPALTTILCILSTSTREF
jgi:hypothetical protein